jgi:Ca2+-binding RTX toxin-like protein
MISGGEGNDKIFGGSGSDTLDGGVGNNILTGGKGRDVFVLAKGAGRSIVKDFQLQQDQIGLPSDLSFKDLTIEQKGSNTLISVGNDRLMLLMNTASNQIGAEIFKPI